MLIFATFRIFVYPEMQLFPTEQLFCQWQSHLRLLTAAALLKTNAPLPPNPPITAPATHSQGPSTVFFEQNGCLSGTGVIFMCKCQSVRSSNHKPVFSGDHGLRHSLNNLAALCHNALGSQPSKVMTERRWLTSPPIHSHYHLFTVSRWSQTEPKATPGKQNQRCCINCVIKQSCNKQ